MGCLCYRVRTVQKKITMIVSGCMWWGSSLVCHVSKCMSLCLYYNICMTGSQAFQEELQYYGKTCTFRTVFYAKKHKIFNSSPL